MRKVRWRATVVCATFLAVVCAAALVGYGAAAAQTAGYHLAKRVVLGGDAHWDYFDVDPATHRVFIPRGKQMTVLDPDGKVVADIAIPKGAHAIVFAPELRRGFTGSRGVVTILDLEALKVAGEVDIAGKGTDFMFYDPGSQRVFTLNPDSKDATAIDAKTGKVVGDVALGGDLEAGQADGLGHAYVNVVDKNQIVEFDTKSLKVLSTWPIANCNTPHGLGIDVAHKRLFVGCRNNRVMNVIDSTNGKLIASIPIGNGTDSTTFDPASGLAFSSCGDGTITVAHEDSADKFTVVQTVETQKGSKTMALDTGNHNIYGLTAEFVEQDYPGYQPIPTPENPHPRRGPPTLVPNTFTLLIYSR